MKIADVVSVAAVAFAVTLAVTPLAAALARRRGVLSSSSPHCRSDQPPVPLLGGLAMVAGVIVALWLVAGSHPDIEFMLMGALGAVMLGLIDDVRNLLPRFKFFGQICVAVVTLLPEVAAVGSEGEWRHLLAAMAWIVFMMNAVNLCDGIDGLAAFATFIVGISGLLFTISGDNLGTMMCASTAGAAAAFLVYNFPPASIYMGDTGSLFLGYLLALMTLRAPATLELGFGFDIVFMALMVGVPVVDTLFVTVTRIVRGVAPWKGGHDHIAHRMMRAGISERGTVLWLAGANLVSGCAAAFLVGNVRPVSRIFAAQLLLLLRLTGIDGSIVDIAALEILFFDD